MLREKLKSIPYKQYLEIIKPDYSYVKIIPDKSVRNYNSSNIAKSIAHTFKAINKRIKVDQKKVWIELNYKISYVVDIQKDNVAFYFIVPSRYKNIIIEKIREIWTKVTIEEVERLKGYSANTIVYQMNYKKEDALSLAVDKKSNEPLNSLFSVLDIMKDTDRVTIIYNFLPIAQFGWKKRYEDTMLKIKANKPIERQKISPTYITKFIFSLLIEILDSVFAVLNDFMGGNKLNNNNQAMAEIVATLLETERTLSLATKKKKEGCIIDLEMLVISESEDTTRKENNALSICQGYRVIDEDNELVYKKVKHKYIDVEKRKIVNSDVNTISTDEAQNFIQLPGKALLQDHNIKHINTSESQVPESLSKGDKCIGTNTYKGKETKVHLTTDRDYKNLAVAIVGPTRSGKTSLLGNMARDSIKADECVIVLDYIENCGLSEDIKKCIPKDKILEINLHDYKNIQGLGYNEAIKETNEAFLLYESAKQQTSQVITLVNSINISNSDFTPKMERYLNAACLIAFVNKGAIKDVISTLTDHNRRKKGIESVPKELKEYLEEYINYLKELDELDKEKNVVGTKLNNIVGVLDRFARLKSNTYMELMLKTGIENNINLYEEMQKNQCIFIKMPESMFSTAEERDALTTYWLTKIWMAGQVRAWKIQNRYDRKTVTVITDEIAQLNSAERYLGSKLDQTAKFGIKFILSTMYINQLRIKEKLRTANTSYIFIAGADKNNFKEMKEEFEEKGFELEDMQNLKRFHAINYLKYEEGYWGGIIKLPKPI